MSLIPFSCVAACWKWCKCIYLSKIHCCRYVWHFYFLLSLFIIKQFNMSRLLHLRVHQRSPVLVKLLWEVPLLHSTSQNQWPSGRWGSSLHTAIEARPCALHCQELEELCQPLGHELRRADYARAADAWLHLPQSHSGVPVPIQPETGDGAHQALPVLPAYWCPAASSAVGGKWLALTLEASTLAKQKIRTADKRGTQGLWVDAGRLVCGPNMLLDCSWILISSHYL